MIHNIFELGGVWGVPDRARANWNAWYGGSGRIPSHISSSLQGLVAFRILLSRPFPPFSRVFWPFVPRFGPPCVASLQAAESSLDGHCGSRGGDCGRSSRGSGSSRVTVSWP